MKVYGYNAAKDVIEIELPIHRVVDSGIHPRGLDLFDRCPIQLRIDGATYFFSRLRDVSFVYYDKNYAYIGICSEGEPRCFRASDPHNGGDWTYMKATGIVDCSADFQYHFAEYWSRAEPLDQPMRWIEAEDIRKRAPELGRSRCVAIETEPRYDETISYQRDKWLPQVRFFGRMSERLKFDHRLPEPINWALELLSDFKPVVFGDCIRQALKRTGANETDDRQINIAILNRQLETPSGWGWTSDNLVEFLASRGITATPQQKVANIDMRESDKCTTFVHNSIQYNIVDRFHDNGFDWPGCSFSTGFTLAIAADRIATTRIALHDLALKQTRLVASKWTDPQYKAWAQYAQSQIDKGLRFLPTYHRDLEKALARA